MLRALRVSDSAGVNCLVAFFCLVLLTPGNSRAAEAVNAAIRDWQALRFGMFIHWGPVSIRGTEIGQSRGQEVPVEEYDQLYKRFNPTLFDAEQWVHVAKDAGMKYLVITAKHHDGFCLWPSQYTDYTIAATPFKRDVLKELSEACKKNDIKFCTYYSICDWHHPDYPFDSPWGRTKKPHPDMARYFQYVEDQTAELVTNYGPLGLIWFDGEWEPAWNREYGNALYDHLKALQPSLVINNRVSRQRRHDPNWQGSKGDYDTPEQRIGQFNRQRPWETCMTICRQWAWKPNDIMKSRKECIQTLLLTVGGDGNFLFNVGPMPDGRIEPRQVARLKEMGEWLKKYGEGVYGTRGGPFKPGLWGASTSKDNHIYLYVMRWPGDGPLELPAIDQTVTSAKALSGGHLTVDQSKTKHVVKRQESGAGKQADVDESTGRLSVFLPKEDRDDVASVIELTVDGDAVAIEPVDVDFRSGSLAYEKGATSSNVFQQKDEYSAAKAVDDNPTTRWATDPGVHSAWLEVDLGKPQTIGRFLIDEPAEYRRIEAFELQIRDGEAWNTVYQGTTIGPDWTVRIEPVVAQRIRLKITKATEGPTIREFQIFGSEN